MPTTKSDTPNVSRTDLRCYEVLQPQMGVEPSSQLPGSAPANPSTQYGPVISHPEDQVSTHPDLRTLLSMSSPPPWRNHRGPSSPNGITRPRPYDQMPRPFGLINSPLLHFSRDPWMPTPSPFLRLPAKYSSFPDYPCSSPPRSPVESANAQIAAIVSEFNRSAERIQGRPTTPAHPNLTPAMTQIHDTLQPNQELLKIRPPGLTKRPELPLPRPDPPPHAALLSAQQLPSLTKKPAARALSFAEPSDVPILAPQNAAAANATAGSSSPPWPTSQVFNPGNYDSTDSLSQAVNPNTWHWVNNHLGGLPSPMVPNPFFPQHHKVVLPPHCPPLLARPTGQVPPNTPRIYPQGLLPLHHAPVRVNNHPMYTRNIELIPRRPDSPMPNLSSSATSLPKSWPTSLPIRKMDPVGTPARKSPGKAPKFNTNLPRLSPSSVVALSTLHPDTVSTPGELAKAKAAQAKGKQKLAQARRNRRSSTAIAAELDLYDDNASRKATLALGITSISSKSL